MYAHADVSKDADVQAMVTLALSQYGRLDVLFNNAGIEGEQAMTADASLENWERVIAINLRGVFLGMKYGIEAMLRGGGGSIINNASVAGLVGFAGIPAYCASKGGVVQLTRGAALEYATQGVRVMNLRDDDTVSAVALGSSRFASPKSHTTAPSGASMMFAAWFTCLPLKPRSNASDPAWNLAFTGPWSAVPRVNR